MGQLVAIKKASVRIPAGHVSPGGAAGLKKLKGAGEQAAQSAWKRSLVGKRLSEAQQLGLYAGGTAVAAGVGEVGGRVLGRRRYEQGRDVRDGFFQGPSVNRGYFKAKRSKEGSSLGTDGAQVRKGLLVSKASHTQDGTGVSVTLRMPKVANKATVVHAQSRSGAFAGKSRGVGRHLTRDENSSPGKAIVRTPSLRDINGKFAGQGPGVKVFHTSGGPGKRAPRDNRVQRWTGGKSDDERKGMLGPVDLGSMQLHTGARVGRRLPFGEEVAVGKSVTADLSHLARPFRVPPAAAPKPSTEALARGKALRRQGFNASMRRHLGASASPAR